MCVTMQVAIFMPDLLVNGYIHANVACMCVHLCVECYVPMF